MQFTSLLVLALATAVAAKGDKANKADNANKTLSTEQTCKEMTKLQKFVAFAANESEVATVTKNNATKIANIELKASDAADKLSTLQANTTLMSSCAVVDAQQATTDDCQKTFALQRFIAFAANSSAVADVTQNNATKISEIQAKASDAQTKLQTLTSNSTLQSFCPAVQQADECKFMNKLQKFVDVANNQTKLTAVTKGNATKAAELKSLASKAATQVSAMTSNKTFVAACNSLAKTQDGISSSKTTSAAASLAFSSETIFMSSIVAAVVGVMLL